MDLKHWLDANGLGRYAQSLADADIDLDVLPKLTSSDIDRLRLPLGAKRRLVLAIKTLDGHGKRPQEGASAERDGAERRQLTVMFCDMVGFTELACAHDPEVLRAIVRLYEDTCAAAIERYDGHVHQRLGDGIVAYFGFPRAHDGEAERCIRAALEIVETFSRLEVPEVGRLQVRIGIASGLVVVSSGADGAVGDTMNLSARLQALAQPGTVVVCEPVRRLAGAVFEYRNLGRQALKGIAQPVQVYAVEAVKSSPLRFEAVRGDESLSPLVGRAPLMRLLAERWEFVRNGRGQVVVLSGDPGIGKSRLVRELRQRIEAEGAQSINFQCVSYLANSALWPCIDHLERALGFERRDTAADKLDKLDSMIRGRFHLSAAHAGLLAALLSIPTGDRYPERRVSPQKQMQETLRAMMDVMEATARERRSAIFFEDVHWADGTTLDVLDRLVEFASAAPILIVLTHRPEFKARWGGRSHVSEVEVSNLTRAQARSLVARLAEDFAMPLDLIEQILNGTDGVPLFIEELTKSIVELSTSADTTPRNGRAAAARDMVIPATLRDSLTARLDRIADGKAVAQIGAVIGREFSYELISAVALLERPELDHALQRLTASGLIRCRGEAPKSTYSFKHALIQEIAYDLLLKSRRAQLHAQIAHVLERDFPDQALARPELVAYHLTCSAAPAAAVPYWLKAAEKAYERVALTDAIAHCTTALTLVAARPASVDRSRQELSLQLLLAKAAAQSKGWTAAEAERAFARARELCEEIGDSDEVLAALWGVWSWLFIAGRIPESETVALEFEKRASGGGDTLNLSEAHHMLGQSRCKLGLQTFARDHVEVGIRLYDGHARERIAPRFGQDSGMANAGIYGRILWLLGYPDRARNAQVRASALAERVGKPFDKVWARFYNVALYALLRDWSEVARHSDETARAADECGFAFWLTSSRITRGIAEIYTRRIAKPAKEVMREHEVLHAMGAEGLLPWTYALLADACRGLDDEAGLDYVERGLAMAVKNGDRWFEPELHRVKGELLLSRGERSHGEAEALFERAIALAREQDARAWELRSSVSLARAWRRRGIGDAARNLVAGVFGRYSEGFETIDLIEARAFLSGATLSRET